MINAVQVKSRLDSELSREVPREMSTESLNFYHGLLTKALGKIEIFETAEKKILADAALSGEGKQQQLTKLGDEALPDWAWLGRVVEAEQVELVNIGKKLFTVESPIKDEVLRHHRERELRDRMVNLNQAERDAAYLVASEQSQSEVLLALVNAPGGSWVSQDVRERADLERGKRANPALFADYQQHEMLHERLSGIADHLAQMFRAYGVDPAKVNAALGVA